MAVVVVVVHTSGVVRTVNSVLVGIEQQVQQVEAEHSNYRDIARIQ